MGVRMAWFTAAGRPTLCGRDGDDGCCGSGGPWAGGCCCGGAGGGETGAAHGAALVVVVHDGYRLGLAGARRNGAAGGGCGGGVAKNEQQVGRGLKKVRRWKPTCGAGGSWACGGSPSSYRRAGACLDSGGGGDAAALQRTAAVVVAVNQSCVGLAVAALNRGAGGWQKRAKEVRGFLPLAYIAYQLALL